MSLQRAVAPVDCTVASSDLRALRKAFRTGLRRGEGSVVVVEVLASVLSPTELVGEGDRSEG